MLMSTNLKQLASNSIEWLRYTHWILSYEFYPQTLQFGLTEKLFTAYYKYLNSHWHRAFLGSTKPHFILFKIQLV